METVVSANTEALRGSGSEITRESEHKSTSEPLAVYGADGEISAYIMNPETMPGVCLAYHRDWCRCQGDIEHCPAIARYEARQAKGDAA